VGRNNSCSLRNYCVPRATSVTHGPAVPSTTPECSGKLPSRAARLIGPHHDRSALASSACKRTSGTYSLVPATPSAAFGIGDRPHPNRLRLCAALEGFSPTRSDGLQSPGSRVGICNRLQTSGKGPASRLPFPDRFQLATQMLITFEGSKMIMVSVHGKGDRHQAAATSSQRLGHISSTPRQAPPWRESKWPA
jgi:hypothetical protein